MSYIMRFMFWKQVKRICAVLEEGKRMEQTALYISLAEIKAADERRSI